MSELVSIEEWVEQASAEQLEQAINFFNNSIKVNNALGRKVFALVKKDLQKKRAVK